MQIPSTQFRVSSNRRICFHNNYENWPMSLIPFS